MVPSAFVFLNALPLTPNGKIDRRALHLTEASGDECKREVIAPRDLLEFQLVQIWENLLDRRPISITDNFFELGGHSLLAVRLAAQVQERLNQTLPLSALVQGASIESLAKLLRRQAGSKQHSTLVAIQPGGAKRPFFCVHPIGGNILCYVELARCAGTDRPFYGLQSAGLNGEESGFARIEEIAARYIEAISAVQPAGPYLLGGWSFGGVVAFEMARQLNEQSQQSAHVALFDSWAPARTPGPIDERLINSDLMARFLADIAGISGKDLAIDFDPIQQLDPQEQLRSVLEHATGLNILPADMKVAQLELLFNVFERNARAFLDYSPPSLELGSRIVLFRASDGKNDELDSPTLGWDAFLSDQLEVRNVTGNHYSMLRSSNARALAEQLSIYLDSFSS
jgi:thioesterase domain-containing protein/acyl carrier protein